MPSVNSPAGHTIVAGVQIELYTGGIGSPILLLHGEDGPCAGSPYVAAMEQHGAIVAPSHPGFGPSPLPDWIDSVDDLAYLYLDLLDALRLDAVTVVGLSLGGWIAAEMAIKSTQRIARLILSDAVGIKVKSREERDFPDIWALSTEAVSRLTFYDPARVASPMTMTDEQLMNIARNREATALYSWEPYMHDPKLRGRLRRIDVPTLLLWGEHDGIASPDYGKEYCASIPGARMEFIHQAAHLPHVEQPQAFADHVVRFMKEG